MLFPIQPLLGGVNQVSYTIATGGTGCYSGSRTCGQPSKIPDRVSNASRRPWRNPGNCRRLCPLARLSGGDGTYYVFANFAPWSLHEVDLLPGIRLCLSSRIITPIRARSRGMYAKSATTGFSGTDGWTCAAYRCTKTVGRSRGRAVGLAVTAPAMAAAARRGLVRRHVPEV